MDAAAPPERNVRDALERALVRYGFVVPVVIVVALWAGTLHHPFVFDDVQDIVHQRAIRSLWPPTWTTYTRRQLAALTFALNWAWTGKAPWSYRLVNVAIHAGSAALAWHVVRRGLGLAAPKRFDPRRAAIVATATATLWATHALHTSSVTYVIHRFESLAGLFLLAMLAAWQSARLAERRASAVLFVGASAASAAAAVLCKEVAVVAPVLLAGYDLFATRAAERSDRPLRALGLALVAVVTWGVLAATFATGSTAPSQGVASGLSRLAYFRSELPVLAHYVRLVLVPTPLSVDYSDWPVAASWSEVAGGVAFVAAAAALTLAALARRPALGFVLGSYFVVLAPTSSFVPLAHELVAERRLYLPSLAIVLLVVVALDRALARPLAFTAVVAAALVPSAWLTFERNRDFRSGVALFSHDLERHPSNARLHFNYAGALLSEQHAKQAAWEHYERTLALDPTCCAVHGNMGPLAAELGRVDDAERHLVAALAENPSSPAPALNAAAFLLSRGRDASARRIVEEATTKFPASPDVAERLAWVLATAHDPAVVDGPAALAAAERALALGRGEPPPISRGATLAAALAAAGRTREAFDLASQLLEQARAARVAGWVEALDRQKAAYAEGRRFEETRAAAK